MVMVVLTGCSTFTIDKVKYYNEVVAKVGEQNITRFELINAYNNYGYTNYVTNGGQSEKEALLSTAESLVERKMLVQYALDNPSKYSLSEYEINKVFDDTITSIMDSFDSNIATARKIYNIDEKETTETDADAIETIKISDFIYERRVDVVTTNDGSKLQYVDINTDEDFEYVIDSKYVTDFTTYSQTDIVNALLAEFKSKLYANNDNEDNYTKICDKAIELACQNLISYEYYLRDANGKKLSTNQDDLLFRYVERTYNSYLESAYITKVNNVYLQEEELSNESIILAYQALYNNDYVLYKHDTKSYNSKITNTGTSNGSMIYYTPDSNDQFGYFLHVLLPLGNVEQELKDLQADRIANHMTDEDYQREQKVILNKIECDERAISDEYDNEGKLVYEEGQVKADKKAVGDVLADYQTTVTDLTSFVNFMFRYTTDTATLSADMPYVMGYNTKTDENHSTMMANFTKEGIRLMKNNIKDSTASDFTGANEYILTSYGIHLLYYVGEVENYVEPSNLANVTIDILASKIVNPATGERLLDRIFDLVYPAGSNGMFTSNTKYSTFETILVDSLYGQYDEVLFANKIKASNKI